MTAASLPELADVERIAAAGGQHVQVNRMAVDALGLPIYCLALGTRNAQAPAVGFFGGVHGLERIGSQIVIAWLGSLVARLDWDEALLRQLEHVRLVFMPVVNPGGMWRGTRANPAGVDLMRNSPVHATQPVAPLAGGQRISAGLPWYRGREGAPMEPESAALCAVVEAELMARPFSLALDCHSGFGLRDRLWFPHAHTREPIPHLPELHALHRIFERTHPHHPYVFEPQSRQYLAHGDLWDHLYLRSLEKDSVFLPLTLEMGSWLWVKKNPRQFFSRGGIFNPLIAHRHGRVMRRHLPLFDFLVRAASGAPRWLPRQPQREQHRRDALARWYAPA